MKRFWLLAAALLGSAQLASADVNWLTDYAAAKAKAKADGKLLLLDFTGSDWCPPCKQLNAAIFSKPKFQEYAAKNLILMEVDFPRMKEVPEEVRKQNAQLAEQFEVQAFPTLVILSADGKTLAHESGYGGSGPEDLIAALEKLRKG